MFPTSLEDKIPGGLADKGPPEGVDPAQVAKGVRVEMEHTDDPQIAREIAYDHLTEDPNYYDKLEKIEKSGASIEERVAFFYQDRMARRVAARFMFSASLLDELMRKIDGLFAHFDPDEAAEIAEWFKDTFRFDSPKTPQGQKDLKNKAHSLWWFLQDAGTKKNYQGESFRNPASEGAAKRAWEQDIKPMAGDLIRYFSNEGGKIVPKEVTVGGNTYLNLVGFDQKKLGHYVTTLESIWDDLKGWRRKALSGGLKVALASPRDFQGTAGGKYKSSGDVLMVRATPKVLKRTHGSYGALDYILVHELGHRYERKHNLPDDFDKSRWWTSPYSRKEGEAFAELFALGHFKIKGSWDGAVQERFENLMVGRDEPTRPELPEHLQKLVREALASV